MRAYSIDLRKKIVEVHEREKISQRQLARHFGVALSFIVKLLKQYRQTRELSPKPFNGGVKLKLTPDNLQVLADLIEENNDATLQELCLMLEEKTGISISRATMGRMSQRLKLTVKKKTLHPSEKDTERVQKLRQDFWSKIRDVPVEDLIFLDEAGVNLAFVRLYARALRGQRDYGTRPQKRGKNVSMIAAISLKGIVASINILGATDGLTFEAFVRQKLVPNLWNGATVVWDNSTIHKGKQLEQALQEVGAKLIYLPPYSPDFNPIENFWSKVKNTLRSLGPRTYQALDLAISHAISQVSLKDICNWFTHSCYCTSFI
ncbi:IS630 family transposase [Microcoleus sp. FACHB-831]|uniref:IS630 family transposase n=1 Tax=Microcoleus sp. FACHB-831 TaxID=2692827 RepID=UPI0016895BC2|nr:IS630 family transposase [Microcoleus sp. FACHB-831]MBD1922609.1 IS630 family transposase [Microcoleus sp. FACHB-831]